jgi:nicotinate-nucleotide pyrophosphorylase (carboxylating)
MLEMFTVDRIIKNALEEDLGWGDVTTDSTIPAAATIKGNFIAKEQGVLCGIEICKRVFEILDNTIVFEILIRDGQKLQAGDILAKISGPARSILKGERVSLNLLQRMSGIATAANMYSEAVQGTNARVVDTRKTMPGLRVLDKYSVLTGGCHNHRFNLSDLILIKDNHIKAAGGIKTAIGAAKEKLSHALKIEVEVESIEQLKEALEAGADIIMLDNMSLDMMREAVKIAKGKALLEASGNVALEGDRSVKAIAQTGVDIISVGALTHSVSAMDISLRFV